MHTHCSSNKRALDQGGCVWDFVVALVLFAGAPPAAVLPRAVKPRDQQQQREQHKAHGHRQQDALEDARGGVRS